MKGSSDGESATASGATGPAPPFWSIDGDIFDVSYDFPHEFCGGTPTFSILPRNPGQSYTGFMGSHRLRVAARTVYG